MTEEERLKAARQKREFPETMEIMDRLRSALADRVFKTPVSARDEREDLYTRVQALDALKTEMKTILTATASEDAVEEYLKGLAAIRK